MNIKYSYQHRIKIMASASLLATQVKRTGEAKSLRLPVGRKGLSIQYFKHVIKAIHKTVVYNVEEASRIKPTSLIALNEYQ